MAIAAAIWKLCENHSDLNADCKSNSVLAKNGVSKPVKTDLSMDGQSDLDINTSINLESNQKHKHNRLVVTKQPHYAYLVNWRSVVVPDDEL